MTSNFGVLTLGDAMITMNPSATGPLRFVPGFERKAGGAELNFAIGCARLGLRMKWISRLGKDEFGRFIDNFARGEGIDMSDVRLVEGYPTSINFKEIREDGSGKTFYYRHNSPILTIEPEDIKESMFEDIDIVHLSGVYLAIDPRNILIAKRVIEVAKGKGSKVSFDPNIRLKLWTIEEARKAYFDLFPSVDILLTGRDEIQLILEDDREEALETFAEKYDINQLVIKDGEKGSKLYTNGLWFEKEAFPIVPIDTVGAGDGFDAGYIYALLNDYSSEERLTFANGIGAMVTTVSGDNEGLPYLEEALSFVHREAVIER
ncbi:2-dehydro-3-deoxygluconokinase [Scopulibacillus darangshiensis]|uniref:2-dehydro-3-deoxygluconokinase n=1 Tax=Scopulibacillus darangshiensis TaxID=442528 RepID=A0A4R2NIN2_9BACL|nr:sugar kinase [Scopulibacillus darangshiensis]TCP21287.1 2-dehydro-3-deoxygluconokinase [Scopulibacillus darangshiensis]